MAKVSQKVAAQRPREIVQACRKLYQTMSFQEINLRTISKETSVSRPTIYNYFESKEEIFLFILKEEYEAWNEDLRRILDAPMPMTADRFAREVAKTMEFRITLLKIQCMNLYEIEEHSRQERLIEFKQSYRKALDTMDACLQKFFPHLTARERGDFRYSFFPFMYGVYPYVYPTQWQRDAMATAGIKVRQTSIMACTRQCIRKLLAGAESTAVKRRNGK